MKNRAFSACVVLSLFSFAFAIAQEPAPTAASELKALVAQVQAKVKGGHKTAAELAPELASFDSLITKYKDQNAEGAAEIAYMRATLYGQLLNDKEQAKSLLLEIKTNFAGTKIAAQVERMLGGPATASSDGGNPKAVDIVGKPAPELHFAWSSQSGLNNLSSLRGKVVVLDFWATWCGPCIASFPHVRELAEHFKGTDVVIVGVTSLQGRVSNLEAAPIDVKGEPEKEYTLTADFMKKRGMTWTVAFSDENVFNPDYGVTGIPNMVIIAPDGTVRHSSHPMKVTTEMIDAVLKESKRSVAAVPKT